MASKSNSRKTSTSNSTVNINLPNFARGLDTLVAATKIRDDELSVANNIYLVDEGSPTKRPGTATYGNTSSGTTTTGLMGFYKSTGVNRVAKVEDGLFKVLDPSTSNWSTIGGASFPSGGTTNYAMTNDILYLSNGVDPLTKFDGTALTRFVALNTPTGLGTARGASLASGTNLYSYRVSAVNTTGETLASTASTIRINKPRNEWNTDSASLQSGYSVALSWTATTGASGYNIYGVVSSFETYLDHVDGQNVVAYTDYGTKTPSSVFTVPAGNTTQAPLGKFIKEFKSSLIIAGDVLQPSRVYFSAGVDKPDSFLISDGGGFIDVSKNSDDGFVTGIANYQDKAIIFKERSIWQLDFTTGEIPALTNIIKGIGSISHRAIVPVENDLFYLGRKPGGGAALYVLGNEPNFLTVLRTNELSARVRPDLQALIATNYELANAVYIDGRYELFYTDGNAAYNNTAMVYDRERLGFTKWPSGVNAKYSLVFYEEDRDEKILYIDPADQRLSEISPTLTDDKGQPIVWRMRTKEFDFSLPFVYKYFKWINMRLRNIGGVVGLKIWRDSTTVIYNSPVSTTTQTGETAFRGWQFRQGRFRKTVSGAVTAAAAVIQKRLPVLRFGKNAEGTSIAYELFGEQSNSKATLLDLQLLADLKSERYYPKTEVIEY